MKRTRIILSVAAVLLLLAIVPGVQAAYEPGWSASYYRGQAYSDLAGTRFDNVIHFADNNAVSSYGWSSDEVNWPTSIVGRDYDFSVMWDGYVNIETAGDYTFYLTSDDGSWLGIDGAEAIDNGGAHGPREMSKTVFLAPGYHHVVVKHFQISGAGSSNIAVAYLEYSSADIPRQFVPGFHMTTNSPEFPSALLPATFVIGLLGVVLLLRRMN